MLLIQRFWRTLKTENKCTVATGPVFVFFPTFQRFSCFPVFFTVWPVFVFFQVKILNFQVFSYIGFLQILENLEKSTNFIKVREKSGIFLYWRLCALYFLSFLRMINFFLAYFLYVYLIEKGCFNALFYLY